MDTVITTWTVMELQRFLKKKKAPKSKNKHQFARVNCRHNWCRRFPGYTRFISEHLNNSVLYWYTYFPIVV